MVARLVLCKPLPGEEKTPTYRIIGEDGVPPSRTAPGGVHVLHRLDLKSNSRHLVLHGFQNIQVEISPIAFCEHLVPRYTCSTPGWHV